MPGPVPSAHPSAAAPSAGGRGDAPGGGTPPAVVAVDAPLGTITEFAAGFSHFYSLESDFSAIERARLYRAERFELQAVARATLPGHRVGICLLRRRPNAAFVEVRRSADTGLAYLSNLLVCGRAAVCPVCGARVAEHNCQEIQAAIDAWKAAGGTVGLITLTMPHYRSQRLPDNEKAIKAAHRSLAGHYAHQRLAERAGLKHTITATEITYGQANGFHPHLHKLCFFAPGHDPADLVRALPRLWLAELRRQGVIMRDVAAVRRHGVRVNLGFTAGAEYLSKVAQVWGLAEELSKSNRKQGRVGHYSPLQLLGFVREGVPWAASVFREYAETVHGLHLLRWSRGLRDAVQLAEEVAEEEIAAGVSQGDELLMRITVLEWRAVRFAGWRARLRLVELADYDCDSAIAYVRHLVTEYERAMAAAVG